jgi:hypothetical protein
MYRTGNLLNNAPGIPLLEQVLLREESMTEESPKHFLIIDDELLVVRFLERLLEPRDVLDSSINILYYE